MCLIQVCGKFKSFKFDGEIVPYNSESEDDSESEDEGSDFGEKIIDEQIEDSERECNEKEEENLPESSEWECGLDGESTQLNHLINFQFHQIDE